MKLKDIVTLVKEAAVSGASKALDNQATASALLTKAEAYRLYGRTQVDRWITEGLVHGMPQTNSSKILISRANLEAVAAASNRITYLPVADR